MDFDHYPKSDKFYIKDTIGVPHPYCVGTKHVVHASENYNGILNERSIESAEKNGARCEVKGCELSYAEHKTGLLIAVKDSRELNDIPELQDYLLSIKDMAEMDGIVGFAFVREEE